MAKVLVTPKDYTINYPGIKIEKINKTENSNYVFIDLDISASAKPGLARINVLRDAGTLEIGFELKPRREGKGRSFAQGVTSRDFH